MNEVLQQRNALWKSLRQAERDFEQSARSWSNIQEELREARRSAGSRRHSPDGKNSASRGSPYTADFQSQAMPGAAAFDIIEQRLSEERSSAPASSHENA